MTTLTPVERSARRRRRRQEDLVRWGIRAVVVLVVFALGIAIGQALHDNPKPGTTITFERTLRIPTSGNPARTVVP